MGIRTAMEIFFGNCRYVNKHSLFQVHPDSGYGNDVVSNIDSTIPILNWSTAVFYSNF